MHRAAVVDDEVAKVNKGESVGAIIFTQSYMLTHPIDRQEGKGMGANESE